MRVACHQAPRPMPHQFAKSLDHPLRMAYREPAEQLGLYGIMAGMTALDLGCGTGTFTVDMARMVGPDGTIHAIDIQEPLLERTRSRLLEQGLLDRVRLHHAGANALPLPDNSVDVAVVIAMLAEAPDRHGALLELRRVLKPEGRLAVSEEMPDPAYVFSGAIRTWAEDAGFALMAKNGTPFCYNLIFRNVK